ncbi:hypothetical protein HNQ80_003779 [Anaerosolibacter carboniphilus]|uniref:Uncharacterized protein n=1 Tax=Anaerosolibacter carboniphilus TaxID=1417629 RepID=A0A841KVG1_9FIRM|nr:hypothetical protein [Anaerosolibacter carboniphilus]MBB6217656.1 hypothetical protein [Anaerosolibacter carboniphilus]
MNDLMKPFGSQSFLIGLGVAAVGYFFGPQIKQAIRPAAVKGAQGVMMFSDKTKEMFDEGKHMMGNMMDKASHMGQEQQMAGQMGMYEMLMKELKDERERSNRLMEQLNISIAGLKDEITYMKGSKDGMAPENM